MTTQEDVDKLQKEATELREEAEVHEDKGRRQAAEACYEKARKLEKQIEALQKKVGKKSNAYLSEGAELRNAWNALPDSERTGYEQRSPYEPTGRVRIANPGKVDEGKWARAKEASKKAYGEIRWPVVTYVYEREGGTFK